jgi:hypothetical protein
MTMRVGRRGRLLICLTALGIAVAVGVYLLLPRSAINHNNFERIRLGMARAEVEAILSGPGRDESTRAPVEDLRNERVISHGGVVGPGPFESPQWRSNDAVIWIYFDRDGKVVYSQCSFDRRLAETPLDVLRRLLHR